MRITETQRAIYHRQAQDRLSALQGCAASTADQLGEARDLLNLTHTSSDCSAIEAAVADLEALVQQAWHGDPPITTTQ